MESDSAAEVVVARSLTVPLTVAKTFELFTARMRDYWPPEHSIGTSPIADVVVEPRVGGRWFERGVDGSDCDWGRVAVWDPPQRVVLLWQITGDWKFDPDFETEVEVSFTDAEPGRTKIDLRHRNLQRYGDRTEPMRAAFDSPDGWGGTLARFERLAEGSV
jgi:hypothetical protein